MKKIGRDLELMIASLTGDDEQARINLRAHQVRERYKRALETVYKAQTPLFLAHTNNVYIMMKDGVKTLIVYVDESIFAAELNAQRELIKLKLLELFGEDIEQFEIFVSRGNYKNNHPYKEGDGVEVESIVFEELDETEKTYVEKTVSSVENPEIRAAIERAMTADLQLKKTVRDQVHDN